MSQFRSPLEKWFYLKFSSKLSVNPNKKGLWLVFCEMFFRRTPGRGGEVSFNRVRELRKKIRNEATNDVAAGLYPPDIIDFNFGAFGTF
jgi:hypothetical protein